MTMQLLEQGAAVLSVPPLFDESTGRDVLAVLVETPGDGDPLQSLRLAGLLEEWDGFLRVAEPLRSDLRARLAEGDPDLFRAAAGRFAAHAANGFGDRQATALGARPAAVSAAVLRVLASPVDVEEPLDDLIGLVASAPAGRRGDGKAAARQLSSLPVEDRRVARAIAFLLGLDAWRSGEKATAVKFLEEVTAHPLQDRSSAIALHLLGGYAADKGEDDKAVELLASSVTQLRLLRDTNGLAQTLTTLGRVQRHRAATNRGRVPVSSENFLAHALSALEEAARLGNELGDADLEGVALVQLARVEQDSGSTEAALDLAQQALGLLRRSEDVFEVQVLLGGLFRDLGFDKEAGNALGAAAELAERTGQTNQALGRVLNVQASVDRRAGRISSAIQLSRQSVEVGRLLKDRRHSAHAKHTLAASLLDRGLVDDILEARTLLAEANQILTDLRDRKGVEMVSRTAARLRSG